MADAAPLVRYSVATPSWVWPVVVLTPVGSAAVAVVALLERSRLGVVEVLLAVAAAAVPLALALWLSRPYRVGAPTIDVYRDHVAVPGPGPGRLDFPLGSLRLARVRVKQVVTVAEIPTGLTLDRGERVTFIDQQRRELSDRVFPAPEQLGWLLADLQALVAGQEARGPAGWRAVFDQFSSVFAQAFAAPPPAADAALEARLDAELRQDL